MLISVNKDTLKLHEETEGEGLAWILVSIKDLEKGLVDIDARLVDTLAEDWETNPFNDHN